MSELYYHQPNQPSQQDHAPSYPRTTEEPMAENKTKQKQKQTKKQAGSDQAGAQKSGSSTAESSQLTPTTPTRSVPQPQRLQEDV